MIPQMEICYFWQHGCEIQLPIWIQISVSSIAVFLIFLYYKLQRINSFNRNVKLTHQVMHEFYQNLIDVDASCFHKDCETYKQIKERFSRVVYLAQHIDLKVLPKSITNEFKELKVCFENADNFFFSYPDCENWNFARDYFFKFHKKTLEHKTHIEKKMPLISGWQIWKRILS